VSQKHRKGSIERVSQLLTGEFGGSVFGNRLKELVIWQHWSKAVGASIAAHTRPLRIYGGQLTVLVSSATWMQQLNFMKEELRNKLNHTLGDEQVKSISFKTGKLHEPEANQHQTPIKLYPLTAKRRQQIEQQTRELADGELAALIKELMVTHYQRYPDSGL